VSEDAAIPTLTPMHSAPVGGFNHTGTAGNRLGVLTCACCVSLETFCCGWDHCATVAQHSSVLLDIRDITSPTWSHTASRLSMIIACLLSPLPITVLPRTCLHPTQVWSTQQPQQQQQRCPQQQEQQQH
jgi:hypothetical protein